MKNTIVKLLTIPLAFSLLNPAWGQSIEETLQDLVEGNAKGYLSPLVTAFGTGINSGTFHRAKPHKILGFDVTLNFSVTTIPDAGLTYDFYIPDQVNFPFKVDETIHSIPLDGASLYPGDRTSSTFFGKAESYTITPDGTYASSATSEWLISETDLTATEVASLASAISDSISSILTINTPKGNDFPAWPTVMPQISVGLPFHTELTLRGFKIETPEGDPISFFGFGAKVYLNQFIPTIPLVFPAISLGYYATNLNMVDVIKANNSILTLQVSKSVPVITVYGGFGIENSSITVDLKDETTDEQILDFSLDGDNSFRTIVGLRLKLAVLSLHVDYNIGEYPAINAGIGLTLR